MGGQKQVIEILNLKIGRPWDIKLYSFRFSRGKSFYKKMHDVT